MEKNFYFFLAEDYDLKRRKPWKALEQYIEIIGEDFSQFSGLCLDLGCANGRNFSLMLDNNAKRVIGIDNTLAFLDLAKQRIRNEEMLELKERKRIDLILSDISFLPLRNKIANNIFLIATLHHIETGYRRNQVLDTLHGILKFKGKMLVTVWRRYQKKYRWFFLKNKYKRIFFPKFVLKEKGRGLAEFGDTYVPWTISKERRTFNRFYHFFSKQEIFKLFRRYHILDFHKFGGPNKKDNFFILALKDKRNTIHDRL